MVSHKWQMSTSDWDISHISLFSKLEQFYEIRPSFTIGILIYTDFFQHAVDESRCSLLSLYLVKYKVTTPRSRSFNTIVFIRPSRSCMAPLLFNLFASRATSPHFYHFVSILQFIVEQVPASEHKHGLEYLLFF